MGRLTERNRLALDHWLTKDRFSGPDAYMRAYPNCHSRDTARAAMARLLAKASAQLYIQKRLAELDASAVTELAYEREQALADLQRIKAEAMSRDANGRMVDRRAAIAAIDASLRIQGKHPDQKHARPPMLVNIHIDLGEDPAENALAPAAEADDEPPRLR